LLEYIERLRALYSADRAANLPGVWLPEGLARKYQNAGLRWEWQWLFCSRELAIDPSSGIRRDTGIPAGAYGSGAQTGMSVSHSRRNPPALRNA
jgi:hypothetical protein